MSSSVITCLSWIRRGEALSLPKSVLRDNPADGGSDEEEKQWSSDSDDSDNDEIPTKRARKGRHKRASERENRDSLKESLKGLEEFNLEDYDEEDGSAGMTDLGSLVTFRSNKDDPYMTEDRDMVDDEEEEDFQLKSDDNLLVVGRTEEDGAIMEVYVFNEGEDSLYVHHDVLLPSFPLAIEPVRPKTTEHCNYVAVGYFTPTIDIWDLDVVDSLEPAFSLGKKKKQSKKLKADKVATQHTDSILDLSWNHNVPRVLASASADETVALWDLDSQKMVCSMKHHKDKVQSVEWHPFEGQCLLTGGCDGLVAAVDGHSPNSTAKTWRIDGEVEKIVWNHFKPHQFFVSSDKGTVQGFDIRTDKHLFILKAHEDAVTSLSLSHYLEGALTTVSADHTCKFWSIQDNKPSLLLTKEPKMGIIHCSAFCPDSPAILALGGAKDSLRTMDFKETCNEYFKKREHFSARVLKAGDLSGDASG